MSKTTAFFLGLAIAAALPLAIDFALFGTITPCETIQRYNDGSTIQKCSVEG